MIFYVLLTYGNRPTGPIKSHPAAKAQLALIDRIASLNPRIKAEVVFDYARSVEGLHSLPRLEKVLASLNDVDGVKVRLDDLSRLFRIAKMGDRERLLEELQVFGSSLYSVKHKKTLSNFSTGEIHNLILHAEKSNLPAQQERAGDTANARAASLNSRKGKSIAVAKQLQAVKNELLRREVSAVNQNVADEANARGIRTTRGGKWTAQNVDRMLKSLERV
ncbi:hypothetical protein [Ruegeria arenilitoris]|uniref:hypothetical protein n=1 Tax=Ruegeria arenilitoris TaxID=1173585 RepID=UPI00147B9318|nr:hypothetical protein [Ruegeria arenilitoris]